MAKKSGKAWGIEADFDEVLTKKLKALDGNIVQVAKKALTASHQYVTQKVEEAWQPHDRTGKVLECLERNAEITEDKGVYAVDVGFRIRRGGMPSIWVMNGTKVFGTPRIKPDTALRNAFYGSQTKEEVSKIQNEAFSEEIKRLGGTT